MYSSIECKEYNFKWFNRKVGGLVWGVKKIQFPKTAEKVNLKNSISFFFFIINFKFFLRFDAYNICCIEQKV